METDARPSLYAYLSYADAPAAIDWMQAIGFEMVRRQDADDRVAHAELRLGDVVVMVASDDQPYDVPALRGSSAGSGLYVCTGAVDELYRRAVAAGGRSVIEPEDTEWGSRRARVVDVGGKEWSFGSYAPGRAW
jgi:uncharacterized glyoxalase superfamily protein PhnB